VHACPDGFEPVTNVYSCQTAATVYNYDFDDTSDVGVCQLCTNCDPPTARLRRVNTYESKYICETGESDAIPSMTPQRDIPQIANLDNGPTTEAVVIECSSGAMCACVGEIRIGAGNNWSEWMAIESEVTCDAGTFGFSTSSAYTCECKPQEDFQLSEVGDESCPSGYEPLQSFYSCKTAAEVFGIDFDDAASEGSEGFCQKCNDCAKVLLGEEFSSTTQMVCHNKPTGDKALIYVPPQIARLTDTTLPEATASPDDDFVPFARQFCFGGAIIDTWDDGTNARRGKYSTFENDPNFDGTLEQCVDVCRSRVECAAVGYRGSDGWCGFWRRNIYPDQIVFASKDRAGLADKERRQCFIRSQYVGLRDPPVLEEDDEFDASDIDPVQLAMYIACGTLACCCCLICTGPYWCDTICCKKSMNAERHLQNYDPARAVPTIRNNNWKPHEGKQRKPKLLPGPKIGGASRQVQVVRENQRAPDRIAWSQGPPQKLNRQWPTQNL